MIADIDAEKDRLRHEIRQVIARLDLMPHAATQNFEPSPDDTAVGRARGGGRPAGGVSVGDDLASRRTDEDGQPQVFRQLSADHFRHRLSRAHSLAALRSVLEDARKAEKAWKCTPIPDQPLTGSSAWKLWVREDTRSDSEIARLSGVSRRYVSKVREGYRGEAEDREAVRRRRGEAVLKRRAA